MSPIMLSTILKAYEALPYINRLHVGYVLRSGNEASIKIIRGWLPDNMPLQKFFLALQDAGIVVPGVTDGTFPLP